MNKILKPKEAIEIARKLKKQGRSVALVGGFFDILHIGHIKFLEKAKEKADALFVFLESDEQARKLKGENRPVNTQKARAEVLSALKSVDYIVLLPKMKNDKHYDKLVTLINPMIIAVTKGDKNIKHKIRQAEKIGAVILPVLSHIPDKSTSKLAKIIEEGGSL